MNDWKNLNPIELEITCNRTLESTNFKGQVHTVNYKGDGLDMNSMHEYNLI